VNKFLTFILTASSLINLYAQSTWVVQNSGTAQDLWAVHVISNEIAVVAGNEGTLLKTTDGGASWVHKNSHTTDSFWFLQFLNASTGFAGGSKGTLLKTIDAGNTWSLINLPDTNANFGGFWFIDENTGIRARGSNNYTNSEIFKTTNGGATWVPVYNSGGGWLSYSFFSSSSTGYSTVSGGTIYKTTDEGNSWNTISLGYGSLWTSGVFFFDDNIGFVGGGYFPTMTGILLKTTDGGSSWQEINNLYSFAKIMFTDQQNGFALAAGSIDGSGYIVRSTDGGSTWGEFQTPLENLNGFHFSNSNFGYAVGKNGTILRYSLTTGVSDLTLKESEFQLFQNFPNPFNPSTLITFNLPKSTFVTIKIFNSLGELKKVIMSEEKVAGSHQVSFNGSGLSSGVYYYQLAADNFISTKKAVIIK
jgi:photosystem II stability/assembly factor-like uncharacterized protein